MRYSYCCKGNVCFSKYFKIKENKIRKVKFTIIIKNIENEFQKNLVWQIVFRTLALALALTGVALAWPWGCVYGLGLGLGLVLSGLVNIPNYTTRDAVLTCAQKLTWVSLIYHTDQLLKWKTYKHTHTHTHPFNGFFSRTTRVSRYQKGKTKSSPRSIQITTPAPHHSVFYRPDALPGSQTKK